MARRGMTLTARVQARRPYRHPKRCPQIDIGRFGSDLPDDYPGELR
jgi:hypothetical protein